MKNVWHDIKSSSLKSKSLTPTIFSNWLIEDPLESKQQLGRKIFFERVFCIDVVVPTAEQHYYHHLVKVALSALLLHYNIIDYR